jgi:hypothetical protein
MYYPGNLKIQWQYQSYFYFSIKHKSCAFHLIGTTGIVNIITLHHNVSNKNSFLFLWKHMNACDTKLAAQLKKDVDYQMNRNGLWVTPFTWAEYQSIAKPKSFYSGFPSLRKFASYD